MIKNIVYRERTGNGANTGHVAAKRINSSILSGAGYDGYIRLSVKRQFYIKRKILTYINRLFIKYLPSNIDFKNNQNIRCGGFLCG